MFVYDVYSWFSSVLLKSFSLFLNRLAVALISGALNIAAIIKTRVDARAEK